VLRKCAGYELAVVQEAGSSLEAAELWREGSKEGLRDLHSWPTCAAHEIALKRAERKRRSLKERCSLFHTNLRSLVVTVLVAVAVAVSVSLPRVLQALLWGPHGINT